MSELTDGEYQELVKRVPVYQGEVKAEPPYEEQISRQIRRDQKRLEQQQYSEELEAKIKRRQEADKRLWEISTQGRHRLVTKEFQVLFRDGECPVCSQNVKYVLDGWNMWREAKGYSDVSVPYESSEIDENLNFTKKHSCPEDPIFLRKRIEYLENNIKLLDKSIDDRIRQALYINAAGR